MTAAWHKRRGERSTLLVQSEMFRRTGTTRSTNLSNRTAGTAYDGEDCREGWYSRLVPTYDTHWYLWSSRMPFATDSVIVPHFERFRPLRRLVS
jgi:hypothetical protein